MTTDTFTRVPLPSGFEYDKALRPFISIASPNQSNPTCVDPPIPLRPTLSGKKLYPETADETTALLRRQASTSTSDATRFSSCQG